MMRHLQCCALLVTLAVGCDFDDEPKNPDGGTDAGSADSGADSGSDSGTDSGSDSGSDNGGSGGAGATGGKSGSPAGGRGGAGGGGRGGSGGTGGSGGSPIAGSGATGGGSTEGGTGGSDTGGVGGEGESPAGEGGGGSPAPDAGTTDPEPALLELVRFEGIVSQAIVGQTIRGTVQWLNASSTPIVVSRALITARAPGATPDGGPFDDFDSPVEAVEVAPGDTFTVTGKLLLREVIGEWSVFPTYADSDGVYRDFPGTRFNLVTEPEYGSFENSIWPVADPADSPNEDRRFALACYKKLTTGDSARCTARYGLGTLPYQVTPSQLTMLQSECVTEGGVLLDHACPTNQMLQLCWEDTRSPAYAYSCEYYGDPNNKSPQFPGAAPDIVFYNDSYLGRNPMP